MMKSILISYTFKVHQHTNLLKNTRASESEAVSAAFLLLAGRKENGIFLQLRETSGVTSVAGKGLGKVIRERIRVIRGAVISCQRAVVAVRTHLRCYIVCVLCSLCLQMTQKSEAIERERNRLKLNRRCMNIIPKTIISISISSLIIFDCVKFKYH
jgi:hypothetical protein